MTDRLKMTVPEDCSDASIAMVTAKNPQAFVLTCTERQLERWQIEQIKSCWERIYRGTPLERVPLVILDKTFSSLQIVDVESLSAAEFPPMGEKSETKEPYIGLNGDIR